METNSVEFFRKNGYSLKSEETAPILIAWKLSTPENCGNLIRLADTIGCRKVLFVRTEIQLAERKIKKIAGESYNRGNFFFVDEAEIEQHIPENYSKVALETAEASENIFSVKLPEKMALIVGNEKAGVDSEILAVCNHIVHIPLTGNCTSLNVSHATAVALFEWLRQNI